MDMAQQTVRATSPQGYGPQGYGPQGYGPPTRRDSGFHATAPDVRGIMLSSIQCYPLLPR